MSNKIEPKVVKNWLSDGKEIAFVDIRELGQHTAGHPFFSISIPFSVFEFSLETLVPNKKTRCRMSCCEPLECGADHLLLPSNLVG